MATQRTTPLALLVCCHHNPTCNQAELGVMQVAGSVLCAFLLACCHALLLAPAAANDTTPRAASFNPSIDRLWPRLAPDPHASHASVIAILSSRQLIQSRFRHVCGARKPAPPNVPDLPEACLTLQGACHRVFRSSLTGIAGCFTRPQLAALQHCAGPEGITYLTRDGQVRSGFGPHCSLRPGRQLTASAACAVCRSRKQRARRTRTGGRIEHPPT